MKKLLAVLAACFIGMTGSIGEAFLVVSDPSVPLDITAFGFGVAPPVLTLQAVGQDGTVERGCTTPTNLVSCTGLWSIPTYDPMIGAVNGPGKNNTPTLASLGITTSYAELGLLFNVNENGSAGSLAADVTINSLSLGIFNGTTMVGHFDLPAPVTFSNIVQGQGGAGFVIGIDSSEWNDFAFNSNFMVGVAANIADVSDGAESFTAVKLPSSVPEPSTLLLLGTGLAGLGGMAWRRRKS